VEAKTLAQAALTEFYNFYTKYIQYLGFLASQIEFKPLVVIMLQKKHQIYLSHKHLLPYDMMESYYVKR